MRDVRKVFHCAVSRQKIGLSIQGVRGQVKAIKEAVASIEFRLSQLESLSQSPSAKSEREQPAKRPPGVEQKQPFKLKVRRSNR